jgi:hypothetical protein
MQRAIAAQRRARARSPARRAELARVMGRDPQTSGRCSRSTCIKGIEWMPRAWRPVRGPHRGPAAEPRHRPRRLLFDHPLRQRRRDGDGVRVLAADDRADQGADLGLTRSCERGPTAAGHVVAAGQRELEGLLGGDVEGGCSGLGDEHRGGRRSGWGCRGRTRSTGSGLPSTGSPLVKPSIQRGLVTVAGDEHDLGVDALLAAGGQGDVLPGLVDVLEDRDAAQQVSVEPAQEVCGRPGC